MTLPTTSPTRFIGCDVGKASIVVFDSQIGKTRTIANHSDDLAILVAGLDTTCLVVCEATGGHEAALLDAAIQGGIPAHRADARKVKAFIRSFGTLGKTDAIDARALARYGQERHAQLPRWQLRDEQRQRLQSLVLTRRDLLAQKIAFANRLKAPLAAPVQPYLQTVIDCLDAQIDAIEAATKSLIRDHKTLDHAATVLQTIAGLGAKTATGLIALMPELGTLTRRQAAALAGLAPHPNQSGGTDGYRSTKGGRPEVKRLLFMAALAATKHNKTLRDHYQKLIANGKKPLIALTAIMRKLVVIANAILRDNSAQI